MSMVEVSGLSYAYGRVQALEDLDLTIPAGALYALVGPNGSGKTTLMQVLLGLRRAQRGSASVMGRDCGTLDASDRTSIGYIAEGQSLPGSMCLREVEAFLAPLYPTWDPALARDLRDRFALDPPEAQDFLAGEQMKAALLCALAPRPTLLVMDEPFTGMDALVRDDLVRGCCSRPAPRDGQCWCARTTSPRWRCSPTGWASCRTGGCVSRSPWSSFTSASSTLRYNSPTARRWTPIPRNWFTVEQNGLMMSFIAELDGSEAATTALRDRFAGAARLDVRDATLREVFIALARGTPHQSRGWRMNAFAQVRHLLVNDVRRLRWLLLAYAAAWAGDRWCPLPARTGRAWLGMSPMLVVLVDLVLVASAMQASPYRPDAFWVSRPSGPSRWWERSSRSPCWSSHSPWPA